MGRDFNHKLKGSWKAHLGEYDMVLRRVDPNGEAFVWCRKCRLGPTFMNRCRPETKDTNERVQMLTVILEPEGGEVPGRNAEGWKVEGEQRSVTRKECKNLRDTCEDGGCMAQKALWNIDKKRMLEDRGALPNEEGNWVGYQKAMHKDNFSQQG